MILSDAFAAIADPHRRHLREELRRGPKTVSQLAAGLPVSRPAVSQHLRILRGAGLLKERRVGTKRLYTLRPEGLDGLRSFVESFWAGLWAYTAAPGPDTEGPVRAALDLDAIRWQYVTGVPDPVRDEVLGAVIVPKPGAALSEESVCAFCREALAAYKVPRLIRFAAEHELPLTTTGKLQKNRLADTFFADHGKSG